jgi:hypothetical protein
MSTPNAVAAINTLLQLGNGASPEVYTTVANVGDLTGPTLQATVVDVTSQSTGSPWREKIVTLLDPGQVSCPLYFVPDDAGHQLLLNVFQTRASAFTSLTGGGAPWRLIFPDQDSTRWSFNAYISKFSTKEPVAGVITADFTLELTGSPNFQSV